MSGAELAPGQPEAAGTSNAVVPAPVTDGSVDLSVHPSGIVPQLQCVPALLVPTTRLACFLRVFPSQILPSPAGARGLTRPLAPPQEHCGDG